MAINQSVRRHLDDFTRSRIIGKLEEGRSVTSVWLQSSNCSQHRFTTLDTISNYRNSYPGFSSGRLRGTTPADDRYIVLQARRNRRQTAEKSLDTRHRRLDDRYRVLPWPEDCKGGGLFARRPVRCTFNACPSEKAFSVVPGNTGIGDTMNGDEYSLQTRADSV
ncbi:hypothetical protein TNCV_2108431 [Trichonephila clavipes]|nr:hypothetical protein TNCV_2108431 [Trichonephila clavipes]